MKFIHFTYISQCQCNKFTLINQWSMNLCQEISPKIALDGIRKRGVAPDFTQLIPKSLRLFCFFYFTRLHEPATLLFPLLPFPLLHLSFCSAEPATSTGDLCRFSPRSTPNRSSPPRPRFLRRSFSPVLLLQLPCFSQLAQTAATWRPSTGNHSCQFFLSSLIWSKCVGRWKT